MGDYFLAVLGMLAGVAAVLFPARDETRSGVRSIRLGGWLALAIEVAVLAALVRNTYRRNVEEGAQRSLAEMQMREAVGEFHAAWISFGAVYCREFPQADIDRERQPYVESARAFTDEANALIPLLDAETASALEPILTDLRPTTNALIADNAHREEQIILLNRLHDSMDQFLDLDAKHVSMICDPRERHSDE